MSLIYIDVGEDDAAGASTILPGAGQIGTSNPAVNSGTAPIWSSSPTAGQFPLNQGGFSGPAAQGYGTINFNPIVATSRADHTLTAGPIKTSAVFVIVKSDGSTLEMNVKNKITPIEILNITKFISIACAAAERFDDRIQWSKMISTLGIDRHFVVGRKLEDYKSAATSELYLTLHDAE
jgi:hypothetical protein